MKTLITLLILLFSTWLFASESGYDYDPKTGNTYRWQKDYDGSTKVRGSNYRTGSTWQTTIENDGDMRGRDSNGDYWKYDSSSKRYNNLNTGEMCIGSGATRVCTD